MTPSEYPIPSLAIHAEEASFLWTHRGSMLFSSRVTLDDLARYDERVEAHLDGLRVAAEDGDHIPELADDEPGALFAPGVLTVESRDDDRMDRLIQRARGAPQLAGGLLGALGWVSARWLSGTAKRLLQGASPIHRGLGVGCCGLHGVDPGQALDAAVRDADSWLRGRALTAVAQVGRTTLMGSCLSMLEDPDPDCRIAAASSAVLLGDRHRALDALVQIGLEGPARADDALGLALAALPVAVAHEALQRIALIPQQRRRLIKGSGLAGDAGYVPWLLKQMEAAPFARLAAEAFTTITGVDLSKAQLEGAPPIGFESGPNEDPDDPNVETDPDEGLPWPQVERVREWWGESQARFAAGSRLFLGAPVTRGQCLTVLRHGNQRLRVLAAQHLCLLEPGTPLFNTSAPAWRQQRLLAQIS